MRVDFLIVGAQKCGTTALADQLARHEGVCFASRKEPHFFSRAGDAWRERLPRYHALFDPLPGQICGEASTTYTFLPRFEGTADRIHAYNPSMRIVYAVREPVDRIVSHWLHRRIRNRVRGPIERDVLEDPAYLDRSRYATQIEPYLSRFGREGVQIVVFEEYTMNVVSAAGEVARFLGLMGDVPAPRSLNRSAGRQYFRFPGLARLGHSVGARSAVALLPEIVKKRVRRAMQARVSERPTLPTEVEARIREELAGEIERLEGILGRPVEAWR